MSAGAAIVASDVAEADHAALTGLRGDSAAMTIKALFRGLRREAQTERPGLLTEAMMALALRMSRAGHHGALAPILAGRLMVQRRPVLGRAWAHCDGAQWQPRDFETKGAKPLITIPEFTSGPPLEEAGAFGYTAACLDIVACDEETPGRFWSRRGALELLGGDNLAGALQAALEGPAAQVRLYRWPLDWAKAGGPGSGGVCLLEEGGPAERSLLLAPGLTLVCDDLEHGEIIERRQQQLRAGIAVVAAGD